MGVFFLFVVNYTNNNINFEKSRYVAAIGMWKGETVWVRHKRKLLELSYSIPCPGGYKA